MAQILLICSLNCDRLFELSSPLAVGGRTEASSGGCRLGGAGANAGSALVMAGHRVAVACALGSDEKAAWIIEQAQLAGLNTQSVARLTGPTPDVWVLKDPSGERSIVFVDRAAVWHPPVSLLDRCRYDALFVNSPSDGAAKLMAIAAQRSYCRVIAQLPQRVIPTWPAHLLVGAENDLSAEILAQPFAAARAMAGDLLQWVVITRGAAGAVAYGADRVIKIDAAPVARVVDATGAGDLFAAGLIDALLLGQTIDDALARAAQWGACAVASASSVSSPALKAWLAARSG